MNLPDYTDTTNFFFSFALFLCFCPIWTISLRFT